jgi:hypothetical protein
MIAVLSATEHDYYAMPLPFAVFSWWKIGVNCMIFIPSGDNPKLRIAEKYCGTAVFNKFYAEEKRIPTYSQVSRLFGAANYFSDHDDIMITADSDMCVFSDYFEQLNNGNIHIVGSDLTPQDQYPMCFAAMPIKTWRNVMGMWHSNVSDKYGTPVWKLKTYQECVSALIDPIEGLNIRGEQWSYDQWYLKKMLDTSCKNVVLHPRSNGQNQFATKRADRDGWHFNPYDIIDAHLPRPLTDEQNFNKVCELFKIKYPNDDLQWMVDYRNEYLKLP